MKNGIGLTREGLEKYCFVKSNIEYNNSLIKIQHKVFSYNISLED